MSSRMERYKNKTVRASRSSRNKSLYNSIYSYDDRYSNIEGVASIDKENEIDISKVKRMLENRENSSRRSLRSSSIENTDDYPILKDRYKEEDRNYDIVDVLKEAKEKKEPDDKERVLNNTDYDILKKLNLKPEKPTKEHKEEDLSELIETIANTSMLNKNKEDTSSDMFSDLLSDDTKVGDVKDFTEFTSMMNEKTMDDSFFTGGVRLKQADFVGSEKEKGSFVKTLFLILFIFAIIAAATIFALKYFNIIDF